MSPSQELAMLQEQNRTLRGTRKVGQRLYGLFYNGRRLGTAARRRSVAIRRPGWGILLGMLGFELRVVGVEWRS